MSPKISRRKTNSKEMIRGPPKKENKRWQNRKLLKKIRKRKIWPNSLIRCTGLKRTRSNKFSPKKQLNVYKKGFRKLCSMVSKNQPRRPREQEILSHGIHLVARAHLNKRKMDLISYKTIAHQIMITFLKRKFNIWKIIRNKIRISLISWRRL